MGTLLMVCKLFLGNSVRLMILQVHTLVVLLKLVIKITTMEISLLLDQEKYTRVTLSYLSPKKV